MKSNLILKSVFAIALLAACNMQSGKTKVSKARNAGNGGAGVLAGLESATDVNQLTPDGPDRIDPKTRKPIPNSGTRGRRGNCLSMPNLLARLAGPTTAAFTPTFVSSYDLDISTILTSADALKDPKYRFTPDDTKSDANNTIRTRLFTTDYTPALALGTGIQITTSGPLDVISKYFTDINPTGQKDCTSVTLDGAVEAGASKDAPILSYQPNEIRFVDRSGVSRDYIVQPDSITLRITRFLANGSNSCLIKNLTVQQTFVITLGDNIARVAISPSFFTFLANRSKAKILSKDKPSNDLKINTTTYKLVVDQLADDQSDAPACPAN
jgi:hypothetical protein